MISDNLGQTLHDRSTRGETLSAAEQNQLERWYDDQDNLESHILGATTEEKTIAKVQSQIEATLTQLTIITKRMQDITSENEMLRQETNNLHHQLVNSSPIQQTL